MGSFVPRSVRSLVGRVALGVLAAAVAGYVMGLLRNRRGPDPAVAYTAPSPPPGRRPAATTTDTTATTATARP